LYYFTLHVIDLGLLLIDWIICSHHTYFRNGNCMSTEGDESSIR
nr:hypothetical protein [Tanacetum cinerariifolium]